MPSISSCPACHRDLTIPDLTNGRKSLRCPLCDAQFAAEEVLADAVPFPPLAIVVEAEEWPSEFSMPAGPQYSPGDDEPPSTDAANWRESAQESAAAESHDVPGARDTSGSQWTSDDEPDAAAPRSTDFESQVSSMRVAPRVRRQTSPLAMLGQVAGVGLGGVLGLAIGYWVLLWLGGARSDFLELRGKLPRWLRPPVRRHHADLQLPLAKPSPERHEPDRNFMDLAAGSSATREAPADDLAAVERDGFALPSAPPQAPAAAGLMSVEPAELPAEPPQALLDAPSPAPNILPEGYVGPREFKLRSAGDLHAALEQTELALRCPRCQMPGAVRLVSFDAATDNPPGTAAAPPCDVCRGKPVLHLGTDGFTQLCTLGEAVTFVRFGEDDGRREQLRDAAESILIAIGGQRDKRETIGRLAGAWLADGARQTNGIVLAGTVEDARPQGDLFAIRLMLLNCGKHVEVVCRQPPEPALARRDHVVMLGSIIDHPENNLVGYAGDAEQVIWGGMHFKVVD